MGLCCCTPADSESHFARPRMELGTTSSAGTAVRDIYDGQSEMHRDLSRPVGLPWMRGYESDLDRLIVMHDLKHQSPNEKHYGRQPEPHYSFNGKQYSHAVEHSLFDRKQLDGNSGLFDSVSIDDAALSRRPRERRARKSRPEKLAYVGHLSVRRTIFEGSVTLPECDQFIQTHWGECGYGKLGAQLLERIDTEVAVRESASLLFGELHPFGVARALSDECLAANAVHGGVLLDLGMGLGKLAFQVSYLSMDACSHCMWVRRFVRM